MQRPLYGLATDLTPFAVVGPVTGVSLIPAPALTVASPTRTVATGTASAAPVRVTSAPRIHLSGRPGDPAIKVATVVVGAVFVASWMSRAPRSTSPTPTASVQAAPVEGAPPSTAVKVEA